MEINNLSEDLYEIMNNINDTNISKLGIMFAAADKELLELEKEKLATIKNMSTEVDPEIIKNLAIQLKPDEIKKYINDFKKVNDGKILDIEIKIINAKIVFRQIGIIFDTIKLIVDNRKQFK